MEAPRDPESRPQTESSATAEGEPAEEQQEGQEQQEEDENDVLIAKAQSLMDKITANPENPNPNVLHALSTILETEESSYIDDADQSSTNNRSSHNVGRLGNLIRENDECFDLLSSNFLTENRYSASVQAATTRLLYSCSLTWVYPHVFEDDVLERIRGWAMEEIPRSSGDDRNWKHDSGKRKASNSEMLRTYSTGLLAVCLACGGQLVEDVLTSGLSAKLMRYLRIRVLGDINPNTNQKDVHILNDNKSALNMASKAKEEGRGRVRQLAENAHVDQDTLRTQPNERDYGKDPASVDNLDRDDERCGNRQVCGDDCWGDDEHPDNMAVEVDSYEGGPDGEEKCNIRDFRESKTKHGGKSHKEVELDENLRGDPSRRRTNRVLSRSRSKGRSNEGASENEQVLMSPGSGNRSGLARNAKEKSLTRSQDSRRVSDTQKGPGRNNADSFIIEIDDHDDCFQGCKVGSKDITELVRKAVRAAEAEARAANAPAFAIRAAGDAAAEVVKTAALEEYKKLNDEEAAVTAASTAASTVINAADAVAVARNASNIEIDSENSKPAELEANDEITDFSIPDSHSLAKLRERFCVQCLVILGEYVEVLGPVLHEKGVDVCLALLQRSFKLKETSNTKLLMHDILKLICALAAHRKFSALFVDRGGMQRLLGIPRNAQTFLGLFSCLFTIGSIHGIMERVCALPSNIVHQIVELSLQLLKCH